MEKFVLYSQIDGIYLGSCMGMGFWSKLDPAGQDEAVVFDTKDDAWKHVASWDSAPASDIKLVPVNVASPDKQYANMTEISSAQLPIWNPNPDEEVAH